MYPSGASLASFSDKANASCTASKTIICCCGWVWVARGGRWKGEWGLGFSTHHHLLSFVAGLPVLFARPCLLRLTSRKGELVFRLFCASHADSASASRSNNGYSPSSAEGPCKSTCHDMVVWRTLETACLHRAATQIDGSHCFGGITGQLVQQIVECQPCKGALLRACTTPASVRFSFPVVAFAVA